MSESRFVFPRYIPFSLSFIAGFVDAVIFITLFGLFVAQATGSFVIMGAHWWKAEPGFLVKVLAIPTFLFGGIVASLIVESMPHRRRAALLWTLGLEEALLLGLLLAGLLLPVPTHPDDPIALGAALFGLLAMGLQSALVRLLMPSYGSTNVMTTNTTVVSIDLTHLILAGFRRFRAPAAERKSLRPQGAKLFNSLCTVAGFFAGTLLGAAAYHLVGMASLVLPLLMIDAVAAWMWFNMPSDASRTERQGETA